MTSTADSLAGLYPHFHISGISGIPEISPGDDLAGLIIDAAGAPGGPGLLDGDILVVTSKVVSKAEGRVTAMTREDAVEAETVRVVARRGTMMISQTRHGFVMAAAGVDESNTAPGTVVGAAELARAVGVAGLAHAASSDMVVPAATVQLRCPTTSRP